MMGSRLRFVKEPEADIVLPTAASPSVDGSDAGEDNEDLVPDKETLAKLLEVCCDC